MADIAVWKSNVKKQKLRNEGTTVRNKEAKREPGEKPKAKIKGRLGFRGNVATRRYERLATETPQQREAKLERTMATD